MPRQVLFAACLLAIAATSNTNSFGLVFAPAAEGLGVPVAALGGLRTIENAAAIVVAILAAPLMDRFQRKSVMLAGYATATIASLTLVSTSTPAGAIAYFILNGASIMLIIGSLTAMPGDFVIGRRLNRVMGLIIGSVAFTSILVAPVVGNVSERFDWQAGMLVSAAVTSLAFLITLTLVPGYQVESSGGTGSIVSRYRIILGDRSLLLMLGNNILRFAQHGSVMTFTSTVLIARYELPLGQIGLVFSMIGVMFFVSSVSSGMLLHWIKTRRVLVWGGIAATALFMVALVLSPPLPLMLVCLLLLVAIIASQVNTGTIAVLRLSPWARGAAMSWNELAAGAGSLTGIGAGSIGLALGGVTGLGIVLVTIAMAGAIVGAIALHVSEYTDEDDIREASPVRV